LKLLESRPGLDDLPEVTSSSICWRKELVEGYALGNQAHARNTVTVPELVLGLFPGDRVTVPD